METIIEMIEDSYPEFNLTAIVDDGDKYYFQIEPKNGKGPFFGGVKSFDKKTTKISEVNPLQIKGLVKRLMTEGVNNV